MRAFVNAGLLVWPVWVVVFVALCRPPRDVVELFVYALMTALTILCMVAFLIPKPKPLDRFELVFPPDEDAQSRWEDSH